MIDKRLLRSIRRPKNLYFLGLLLIAFSLPLSKFGLSVGQFMIIGAWFLTGKIISGFRKFFTNKLAVLVAGMWVVHAIGLLWTEDFEYALNDMRVKLPLLVLPIVCTAGPPINMKRFNYVLKAFILAVVIGSVFGVLKYTGLYGEPPLDKRELSVFISHIRFGLMVCLAALSSFVIFKRSHRVRFIWLVFGAWLVAYTLLFGSFTGLSMIFLAGTLYLLYLAFQRNLSSRKRMTSLIAAVVVTLLPGALIYTSINEFYEEKNREPLEIKLATGNGERYYHDTTSAYAELKENGYYIWRNVAWKELELSWNQRSELMFKGKDRKNQNMDATVVRYITSKGWYKDANAVKSLSDEEIRAIENGVANERYLREDPIRLRVHKIIWEFDNYANGGDFNGHSLVLRWVYWKTAWHIFKEHWIYGVGTGDVQAAFDNAYAKNDYNLQEEYKVRAHQQYLTFGLTFGVIGLLYFLLTLFIPMIRNTEKSFYAAFIIIVMCSMLTEDTLETQIGCTFYAFFNSIVLFSLIRSRVYLKGFQKNKE